MEEEIKSLEERVINVIRDYVNEHDSLVPLNVQLFGNLADGICDILSPIMDFKTGEEYKEFPIYSVFERIEFLKRFYKSININIDLDDLISKGIIDFVKDDYVNESIYGKQIPRRYGHSYRKNGTKLVDVINTGYFQDTIIAVHEIGHHMDEVINYERWLFNSLITEGLAETWSLIYKDFYKNEHRDEINYLNINRLRYFYEEAKYVRDTIPFLFVYTKYSTIDKEKFEKEFEGINYEEALVRLKKYNPNWFDSKVEYMFSSVLSCYLFYKYKENEKFLQKIIDLHKPIDFKEMEKAIKSIGLDSSFESAGNALLESLKRYTDELINERERRM